MSIARLSREKKRQLGQFFTPAETARAVVEKLNILPTQRILEPSFGEGVFIFEILKMLRPHLKSDRVSQWCANHLYGCELDAAAYANFCQKWQETDLGAVPEAIEHTNFFTWMPPGIERSAAADRYRYFTSNTEYFDWVIGNPPFGGSIHPQLQDQLDGILGTRDSLKIKKETYAFFLVKSIDLLKPGGQVVFICSDTILTIPTMTGLRSWLQNNCTVNISEIQGAFTDTVQNMLLINILKHPNPERCVTIFGADLPLAEIESTPNRSWRINSEMTKYFTGVSLGDKMVATSGMTVGKNELFVRPIQDDHIEEPYTFSFVKERITLAKELSRARLGKISDHRRARIAELERSDAMEKILKWKHLSKPRKIKLPHADYAYYNKATSQILYAAPAWAVFWRDDGDYVYTFKKNGNWYLHGVGGKKFFGCEGLTWSLIAPRLYTRYLPAGYILDSGAPCAFLRPGVLHDELFFIIGWTLTRLSNQILKNVLNHTRNNQSKDFERLPYPTWVSEERKSQAIDLVKTLLHVAKSGKNFSYTSPEVRQLDALYVWHDNTSMRGIEKKKCTRQLNLI